MPIINTFVDINNTSEWAKVDMESDLVQMFNKLKTQYFKVWLKGAQYTIKWDLNGVISDESSFKIFESHKEILLCQQAMVRPRIQLVSVLLHILIHIYLSHCSKGAVKMNSHDESFRQIMLYFNMMLATDISVSSLTNRQLLPLTHTKLSFQTSHKFIHSPEDSLYPTQWYQCTGICQSYKPFKGVVRSFCLPNEACEFWKDHEEACGGQFFKIFQMTRTNRETEQIEHSYVRNVHYMFPKPRQALLRSKNHLKTNIQARELFDLTDDVAETATIKNLCDVINLDDSEYNQEGPETSTSSSYVDNFKAQKQIFCKCPFCHQCPGTSRFRNHVDSCRGFQEKVVFSLKGMRSAKS